MWYFGVLCLSLFARPFLAHLDVVKLEILSILIVNKVNKLEFDFYQIQCVSKIRMSIKNTKFFLNNGLGLFY